MWTSKYARVAGSYSGGPGRPPIASRSVSPCSVAQVELPRRQLADERAAAEVDALEAQPVLVGEGDDLERHVGQRLGDREPDQDAEDAVVAAGVGDRVQVRADDAAAARRGGRRGCRSRRSRVSRPAACIQLAHPRPARPPSPSWPAAA